VGKSTGAKFEEDVQAVLTNLKNRGLCSWVRLYDSKSARGNFIPAQPGDFVIAAGAAILLECKSSEVHESLAVPKCLRDNVKAAQAAEHRLWHKAGGSAWFIFYSLQALRYELWRGELVGLAYAKRTKLGAPEMVAGVNELETIILAMIDKSKRV
jgi:hypothetical protein